LGNPFSAIVMTLLSRHCEPAKGRRSNLTIDGNQRLLRGIEPLAMTGKRQTPRFARDRSLGMTPVVIASTFYSVIARMPKASEAISARRVIQRKSRGILFPLVWNCYQRVSQVTQAIIFYRKFWKGIGFFYPF